MLPAVLRAPLRRLRAAVAPMRQRGLSLGRSLFVQLPLAAAWRAWRRLATPVNGRVFGPLLNGHRLAAFQDGLPPADGLRLYVIVMPRTLHFLLPCLALLRGRVPLVLVDNGTRRWERRVLQRRQPGLPMFRLRTLPGSSVAHGDVISLLIEHQRGHFGIVDHDCYVFDADVLAALAPLPGECLVGPFADTHEASGIEFPLTHLLAFDAVALCRLMHAYGVDARLYRHAPAAAHAALARIGLGPDRYLKRFQGFHDTLHVLLAVALAEGLRVRVLPLHGELPVAHIGGTSIGSHHTKNLFALYAHLRFIELLDDAEVSRGYRALTWPLRSSAEALARRVPGDPAWDGQAVLEALLARLQSPSRTGVTSP